MKNNKENKVFVAVSGATIRLSSVLACIPINSNRGFFRLYFDNILTLVVSQEIAKDLALSLQG